MLPPFVERCWRAGWTGEKAGQGFYKRVKGDDGESQILVIDPATLEYHPQLRPKLAALAAAEAVTDTGERVTKLFAGSDRVGEFLASTLAPTLAYTAAVTPAIAHSPDDVDRVMRWGFGWELGPFEMIDAIGIQPVLDAARVAEPASSRTAFRQLWVRPRVARSRSRRARAAGGTGLQLSGRARSRRGRQDEPGRQPRRSRRRRAVPSSSTRR